MIDFSKSKCTESQRGHDKETFSFEISITILLLSHNKRLMIIRKHWKISKKKTHFQNCFTWLVCPSLFVIFFHNAHCNMWNMSSAFAQFVHRHCLSVEFFLSACVAPEASAAVLWYKSWREGGFTRRKAHPVNTKQRWFVTSCEVVSIPGCTFGEGKAGGELQQHWGHQGPPYLPGTEFLMRKAPTNAWAAWCCHPGIFYHWSNISRQLL